MSTLNLFMIFSYWLFLSGTVFIAGAFASRALITMPSGAALCLIEGKRKSFGESASLVIFIFSILTLIINGVHLFFHVSVITETALNETVSVIYPFLTKTRYGIFGLLRTLLLAGLVVIAFFMLRRNSLWTRISGIFMSLPLLITLGMSGHQGTEGYFTLPFFLDITHLIAVSLWIGGLVFIRLCYSYFLKTSGFELWDTFLSLIRRFSRIATFCVIVVSISGVGLLLFNVQILSRIINTFYGQVLLLKILMVFIILLLGGVNKFVIIHLFEVVSDRGELLKLKKQFNLLITVEVVIGFGILFATGLLTHLSPED